jgi:ribose 5-phosphate isomerase B
MAGILFAGENCGRNNDSRNSPQFTRRRIMKKLTIAIGSDHAGFAYKEKLKAMLLADGHVVRDFGTHSEVSCDYPDFIRPVALAVAAGEFERGIVLGGSGNGEAMTANRIKGVRCGLCWNEQVAIWNRSHNDGNVLSLGQRTISEEEALKIVRVWLATKFEGGRHIQRIQKIDA